MPFPPSAVTCRIVRVESRSAIPIETARPGDELVLLLELSPSDFRRTLVVEIWRGSGRRAGWERILQPSKQKTLLLYEVHWRDRPDSSHRLTCRVRLDGRLVGSPSVLLTPAADSQGRMDTSSTSAMSDHTQLAYAEAFARLLGRPPENRGPECVPPEDGC